MGIGGTYFHIVKAIYDKPTATSILSGEKLKALTLRSGTRQGSTFITIIQHSSGSPRYSHQRRKRNKMNPDWKGRIKLSLFAYNMILYIENPKHSIRKLLELISEFSKVAGYKINTGNHLHFSILKMKSQKEKLRNQSHLPLQKKNITSGNKLT